MPILARLRPRSSVEDLVAGPIRGELLSAEKLAARARELARGQRYHHARKQPTRLLARLDETRRILDDAYAQLGGPEAQALNVGPAADWLLDNYHVVQEHVREVREALPRGYYRELPELSAGPLAGYPRIYEVAITLISHTEGRADAENVDLFLGAFQEIVPLTLGELWAIPAMLRLGLIENIRRMTLRTRGRLGELQLANEWAARFDAASGTGPDALAAELNRLVTRPPPLTPIFISRFLRQIRFAGGELAPLMAVEQWIADHGLTADDAEARATQRLALTQIMMANSITSLRTIGRLDWRAIIERQSIIERTLREDPAGFYAGMTFGTRDRYRHVVERIAKRTHLPEADVARQAIELARSEPSDNSASATGPWRRHVGYFLVDEGLPELERLTAYRPSLGELAYRVAMQHPNAVFVGGIVAATVMALAAVLWLAGDAARTAWLLVLAFALLPAVDIAVTTVSQLITTMLPPRTLPKLELGDGSPGASGIPGELRTAVVVPTLLTSVEQVQETLANLESQFLANRAANLHFAILSDFTDAAAETLPDDAGIVEAAAAGVRALNARYPSYAGPGGNGASPQGDTFFLFHRPRRWNPQQGAWMGWERKRGKLGEFNRFVLTGAADAFSTIVGDTAPLGQVRYVITLDADTVLPPGAAALLVGAIAHPLNRAVWDPVRRRVSRGYGILQPRVGVSLPSAHHSPFAAVHSGHPGVDPYTTAVSDVYQDLYGEGSFTGKGIYDVRVFEQATSGRFPENTLLSHDLIEGNYARAGLVTDITVYDDYPARYLSHARRKHRWIRGDWQLLRWLTGWVPGPGGLERTRLSLLARWKIVDNLRRSTVEITQLALLVAGWTIIPGSPLRWTLLGLGAITAPWIVSLLLALLRPPRDKSWRAYYETVVQDAVISAQQVALAIAFLPHQALVSGGAIVRTLWRLAVTRRHLLEWEAASQTERALAGNAADVWRRMWPTVAITLALVAFVAAYNLVREGSPPAWQLAVAIGPLALLWCIAPAIAHATSQPAAERHGPLAGEHREQAMRYAERHWRYFDRFVTAETHWLAPDNVQEDPDVVVAMRTSPTNIGLQLLAIVSAHDLGFITLEDMTVRLERVFASLERMRRFRGHFFNWYDLHELRVLEPAYISTVDSGNLAGHLIAVRQACVGIDADVELTARLHSLADRAYRLALAMNFRFLFDASRKLFSIGYQHHTHTLDSSYYDLLASEARLASFVAIANSEVPVEHWFHLGRTLTRARRETALVSWSGSMFEYLMPALVMESFPQTILDQTYDSAVRRQIAYGEQRGAVWGVSESAYNLRDRHQTYQYRAFGVPDLALKRGLGRDLVIAPYASALALMVDPERALQNLAALEKKGALGDFGFYDALDYTRPEPGQYYALVRTFMAHHVGMSVVAFANLLEDNIWQRRFHADPLVRSAELLLHERIPRRLVLQPPQIARIDESLPDPELERPAVREVDSYDTPQPRIALLGRLPYTIMVSQSGGGYSRYGDLAVTRWRADGTRDNTGQFVYVRDRADGRLWSASHQPVAAAADWYHAELATDRVTIQRADGDIETRTEIAVVPEDSAEVRRVTVFNNGDRVREIDLTSYGEVVLAPPDADRTHPAFANLFVETEWHAWCTALTASRRPRSAGEPPLWCAHVMDCCHDPAGEVTYETDRARFIGRGRTTRDPMALDPHHELSCTTGAVLDPVFAIRTRVQLQPGKSASISFTTLVAETRERLFELAGRYHDPHSAQRALDLAWTAAQVELRELDVTPSDAALFQDLAGHLFYSSAAVRAPQEELVRNRGSQPLLWAQGISGDWPIVLAKLESTEGLPTLRQLLAAHRYWRRRGMTVDLVVLNTRDHSYLQELDDRIAAAMFAATESEFVDKPGGVFVRRADQLEPEQLAMLRATARLHVTCDGQDLGHVVASADAAVAAEVDATANLAPEPLGEPLHALADHPSPEPAPPTREPLLFDNGFGGLAANGDYQIQVRGDHLPPAPWLNVIANPLGGFLVSERGAGAAWAGSSQFYRLTPWHNDPVSDPPSDVIYLRDAHTGTAWSATPAPLGGDVSYVVRHAPGRSTFEREYDGIRTLLTLGIAPDRPVKLTRLRVTNLGHTPRRIEVTSYVEWVLGALREHTQHQVHTTFDGTSGAIFACNFFNPSFAGWVAYSAMSQPLSGHTADRREFLGRHGGVEHPAGLEKSLAGTTGGAIDPCAALRCVLELAPGSERELVVILGAADSEAAAARDVAEYANVARAAAAMDETVAQWESRLSTISVHTPEPAFDAMVNRWSLYQALACRMWGRSALYQSSGAYGFRDQLQDSMAFVYAAPAVAREHILRAASRQFVEGDVQHWWHPESGRGVRTRFSDDLVFLPYVVDHYVSVTGDLTVLDEIVPFITMRALEPDEHELYDLPQVSDEQATVYDHCVRALRKACTQGQHGLPLMGIGDWNDGMNRVGIEGKGESVWLAWFLITTLRAFAERAEARGDADFALESRARADAYVDAVEAHGWDGAWYRRAYFDDGTPLGSAENDECRIDAIAQSWSVISGAGDPVRQAQAMASLEKHLVREDARLLMLLTPAFDKTPKDPGYIKGYLPGVRENGAQYTHAALWSVLATARLGNGDRAFELYQMLNPLTHTDSPEGVATYKVEPYVVAADVYTSPAHLGRGGWTWYTGSASWMYRVGLEAILGFTLRGDTLIVDPRVPRSWPEYTIVYRYGGSTYTIVVHEPGAVRAGQAEVTLDGVRLGDQAIPLADDGKQHRVDVRP
ncbi:MAG: carbohydrate-binding protein [Gemmatimonadetes bacterium]|nr:carbohydrate-binding protein [Gemmatimonadota bacterium]